MYNMLCVSIDQCVMCVLCFVSFGSLSLLFLSVSSFILAFLLIALGLGTISFLLRLQRSSSLSLLSMMVSQLMMAGVFTVANEMN